MSDKLTALPTLGTPDDADLIYVVDVDDITDDPAGSSKAIAVSNLVPAKALDDLTDVDTTTTAPVLNDVLGYDGANFVPVAPSGGGGGPVAMDDLTDADTTTTAPVVTDVLAWDGTNWVPTAPSGGGGGGGSSTVDLPVVQSASFSGKSGASVAVVHSTEPGWSVTRTATGTFDITFPTAAPSAAEQVIQVQWYNAGTPGVYEMSEGVWNQTATTCTVLISSDTGVEADEDFTIIRRLPDTSVAVIGGGAGGIELLDTLSPNVSGEYEYTIPAGYDRILLRGSMLSTDTGSNVDNARIYFNGDNTLTNYTSQNGGGSGGSSLNSANTNDNRILHISTLAASAHANEPRTKFEIWIDEPDKTDQSQLCQAIYAMQRTTNNMIVNHASVGWQGGGKTAITSFRLASVSGDALVGDIAVFGYKNADFIGGGGFSGPVKIETITNATAGSFDFTGIPAIYSRLFIRGHFRSDAATNNDIAQIYLNGDTTKSNYNTQQWFSGSTGNVANDCRFPPSVCGASSPAGYVTTVDGLIEDYAGSNNKLVTCHFHSHNTATSVRAGSAFVRSSITAPVNQITVEVDNHPTNGLIGELTLYGEI